MNKFVAGACQCEFVRKSRIWVEVMAEEFNVLLALMATEQHGDMWTINLWLVNTCAVMNIRLEFYLVPREGIEINT